MKRTTSPKTETFVFRPSAFCVLLATFRAFRDKPHSPVFRDFFMTSPSFLDCSSLADFKPVKPVKSVEIIIHYE